MARRSPLELAYVPRGVEEPLLGYYSMTPLTPGGWADLLGEAGLPDTLRRLSQSIAVGQSHRTVEMRCLEMLPALAHLLTERDGPSSASVRAWRLAARVVEQAVVAGGSIPDLARFSAAFPAAGHAVVVRDEEGEANPPSAADAIAGFVDAAMRALSAAVRDPRILRTPEAHGDIVDLGMLQPLLRAVAPDLGLAPPLVRLHDTLDPLRLRLEAPLDADAGWPLHTEPADPAILRRAARIFAPLAHAADGRVTLGQQGVVELRLAASALEFAGAKVELPPELVEEQDLEYDEAHLELAAGALSLGGVVRYDLRASLGGREISQEEFQALAAATQPLVRVGGEWRALKGRALARAKALAAIALHGASMPAMTALGAALAGRYEVRGLAVDVGDPHGELEELVGRLRAPELLDPDEPPDAFQGELRPYQKVGLGWLARTREMGLGALLADDMGLGKTVQVIAYLLDRSDGIERPALIVCPTSVLGNWQRELRRFAPGLSVHIHHGPDRKRDVEALEPWDVVLTSYALLPRDRRLFTEGSWRVLVLDEAQAVKNPLTHAAQTARQVEAGHRVALTGTPVENRLDDLWSIMHILNPGLLGTRTGFRRLIASPIERRADAGAEEALVRMTRPFLLRRRKVDPDVLPDLPPRQDSTEFCTLTVEQAALYQATIDAMMRDVRGAAGIERRGHVLALITRLKQVCNHPLHALGKPGALAGRSGKLDRLTEMLSEALAEGDSALVFTQYAVMGGLLSGHVERELEVERLYLDGSTPRTERERIVDRFQEPNGAPRVLVMSLRAGGLGLNLTAANHVFHFDRWWNPAVEDQASDRAHRIGQTRAVQVHKMVCAGTIEERIDELITGKRDLAARIVDRGVESALSELGDDDLAELVALRES
ncbi:MAG TPA: SNF2-related protein [Gaiellales bacterium]|nr:SNF2-related protein [Gaiellales bacterium]